MSIDAMKQVLAVMDTVEPSVEASAPRYYAAREALRAAIEQVQEPVAWMYHGIRHDDTPHERPSLIWKPDQMDVMSYEKGAKAIPLYTAPRNWQGLTDEELDQAMDYWSDPSRSAYGGADRANGEYVDMKDTWRYIEAKLKEKNT